MQTITITSEKNRRYTAYNEDRPIGTLHYPKWFSQDAEITIGDTLYRIEGKGLFNRHSEILKDDTVLYDVKTKWRGTIISRAKEPHHYYILKPKGFFKCGYVLENYKGEMIMEIKQESAWKFNPGYTLTIIPPVAEEDIVLLALATAHYFRAAMNAAAAATVAAS